VFSKEFAAAAAVFPGLVDLSAAQTLTITARVMGPAAQTNVAVINHADQFDPDPTNNQAGAGVEPDIRRRGAE
jgi:hypothetical protein